VIQYEDSSHTYSFRGQRYISVTQLLHFVTPQFDTEAQAKRMAENHGATPGYWKKRWAAQSKAAAEQGTNFHNTQELLTESQGFEMRLGKPLRVRNADQQSMATWNYSSWLDGVYTELLLWDHHWQLAGRVDKTIFRTDTVGRWADIDDYKTNKKIRQRGWVENGIPRTLLTPLTHLEDCEYNKYALQFSLYQFMLERMGFRAGTRRMLYHPPLLPDLSDDPNERRQKPIIYELPYLYDEVQELLDYTWKLRSL